MKKCRRICQFPGFKILPPPSPPTVLHNDTLRNFYDKIGCGVQYGGKTVEGTEIWICVQRSWKKCSGYFTFTLVHEKNISSLSSMPIYYFPTKVKPVGNGPCHSRQITYHSEPRQTCRSSPAYSHRQGGKQHTSCCGTKNQWLLGNSQKSLPLGKKIKIKTTSFL